MAEITKLFCEVGCSFPRCHLGFLWEMLPLLLLLPCRSVPGCLLTRAPACFAPRRPINGSLSQSPTQGSLLCWQEPWERARCEGAPEGQGAPVSLLILLSLTRAPSCCWPNPSHQTPEDKKLRRSLPFAAVPTAKALEAAAGGVWEPWLPVWPASKSHPGRGDKDVLMTTSSLRRFPLNGAGSPQSQHRPSDGLSVAVQVPWCAAVPADALSSLSLLLPGCSVLSGTGGGQLCLGSS